MSLHQRSHGSILCVLLSSSLWSVDQGSQGSILCVQLLMTDVSGPGESGFHPVCPAVQLLVTDVSGPGESGFHPVCPAVQLLVTDGSGPGKSRFHPVCPAVQTNKRLTNLATQAMSCWGTQEQWKNQQGAHSPTLVPLSTCLLPLPPSPPLASTFRTLLWSFLKRGRNVSRCMCPACESRLANEQWC